jgi:hypothetical protein
MKIDIFTGFRKGKKRVDKRAKLVYSPEGGASQDAYSSTIN